MLRNRIDQAPERRAARQREVDAAAEIILRDGLGRNAVDAPRQRRRVKARRIDQEPALELHRFVAADIERDAGGLDPAAQNRRAIGDGRAGSLGVAEIGEHQGVAVDNAGRRRVKGAQAAQLRLYRPRLRRLDPGEIGDPIALGLAHDSAERRHFLLGARHGQLPEPLVRHAMLGAIGIEQVAALDAKPRLQTAVRIVQPGMNHLAVAGRGLGAELALFLDDQNFVAGPRQGARNRQANHPGPDHDAFDGIAHRDRLAGVRTADRRASLSPISGRSSADWKTGSKPSCRRWFARAARFPSRGPALLFSLPCSGARTSAGRQSSC